MFQPGKLPRYDTDPVLRLIRAARLVAANLSAIEVTKSHLVEAAELLSANAKAKPIAAEDGRKFSRLQVNLKTDVVLPNHPLCLKLGADLPPPSDWLVFAVSRHKKWLHKIASKIER